MPQRRHVRRWAFNNARPMMPRKGVVVVGSHVQGLFMRVSRFPGADETVLGWDYKEALDGGKGSHQAIACARLGLPTHFVGCVGQDRLGDMGASWMTEAGVDLSYLARSQQTATGCGFVMINPEGIPAITTAMGANAEFSSTEVDRAKPILSQAKLVVITLEIPISTALYAARLARSLGAFTILTPAPAEPVQSSDLAGVDLLVPNENEASTLLSESPNIWQEPNWLANRLREYFGLNHEASLVDAAMFGCLTAARAVTVRESIPSFGTLAEIAEFARVNRFDIPPGLRAAMVLDASPAPNGG